MQDEPELDDERWEQAVDRLDEAGELFENGQLADARALACEARDALRDVLGDRHPDFASALVMLAEIALAEGHPDEAEPLLERALAIYDEHLEEHAELVVGLRMPVLWQLARIRGDLGRYEAAEPLLRDAIAWAERLDDPLLLAHGHAALGVMLRFAGRYEEAADAYASEARATLAAGQPLSPEHHHNLAGLALARGDARAAEAHARDAIALREHEDFGLATDLCGLADAIAEQGRASEAESIYRRALAIYASGERAEHPEVAYALHNLADCLVALARPAEAEAAYRESLARKLAAFGPGTPDEAGTRNNLAALLAECGRLDEARAECARALEIAEARLQPEHPIRRACAALAAQLAE